MSKPGFKYSWPPMTTYQCVGKWIGYHVGHKEVSRYHTRGVSEESFAHKQQSMQVRNLYPGFQIQISRYQQPEVYTVHRWG